MKKTYYLIMLLAFLIGGCSQKTENEVPSQTTAATTTSSTVIENPIIYIDGVSTDKINRYLESYWKEKEENVYQYWESGMELPQKNEPDEYDGQWLDFNKREYYYYYFKNNEPITNMYNWEKDLGSIANCHYDYKSRITTGDCDFIEDVEDSFKGLKSAFDSLVEHIKMA